MAPVSELEIDVRIKRYPAVGRADSHVAIENLRITMRRGELVCVLGPSGCGKTTLLNIIAGLDHDFEGHVQLPHAPSKAAPVIGYVFQNPRLLPWRTVIENVRLVIDEAQSGSGIVDDLLAETGLSEFRHAYPERLSVGMSRRVALARAFGVRPDLLLMDEPFVSLDEPTARRLRLLLLKIWQQRPTTVLFVTHDFREAVMLADRIVLLSTAPGSVVADVPVEIPRDSRTDRGAVAAYRERLVRDHPALFQNL